MVEFNTNWSSGFKGEKLFIGKDFTKLDKDTVDMIYNVDNIGKIAQNGYRRLEDKLKDKNVHIFVSNNLNDIYDIEKNSGWEAKQGPNESKINKGDVIFIFPNGSVKKDNENYIGYKFTFEKYVNLKNI